MRAKPLPTGIGYVRYVGRTAICVKATHALSPGAVIIATRQKHARNNITKLLLRCSQLLRVRSTPNYSTSPRIVSGA